MKTASWWSVLLFISAALGWALTALHLPAAVLLGCMLAGIALSSQDIGLGVPTKLFTLAQGVLGCLIAKSLQPSTLAKVASDWPIFLEATIAVIAASAGLGWLLIRRQVLPGTTAVWGLMPGAASAMVLMAEDFGADMRLVAFMQYLRVAIVTAVASLVAGLWHTHAPKAALNSVPWLTLNNPGAAAWTVLLAFAVSSLARWLRIPAGPMIAPLVLAAALQDMGLLVIEPRFLSWTRPSGLLATRPGRAKAAAPDVPAHVWTA